MYCMEEGVNVVPPLYADDSLAPLVLEEGDQLHTVRPMLSLYDESTGASGLNININKIMTCPSLQATSTTWHEDPR
jgi:hypothetical protein